MFPTYVRIACSGTGVTEAEFTPKPFLNERLTVYRKNPSTSVDHLVPCSQQHKHVQITFSRLLHLLPILRAARQ